MLSGSLTKSLTGKQRLAKLLNSSQLRWFSSLCYQLGFRLVSSMAKSGESQIWARNSYASGQLVYGLSDIDFTLVLFDQNSPCDEGPYLRRYELLKKALPFLGEINIYKQSQFNLISSLINRYELDRDPTLKASSLLRLPQPLDEDAEKFTYLFRMFLSDRENLERTPETRIAKWIRHLEVVDADTSQIGSSTLYQNLIGILVNLSGPDLKVALEDYLNLPLIINNRLLDSKLIIFAPQLWHSCFRGVGNLQETLDQISEASFKEQSYFFTQLRWELFGLVTQLPMIGDKFFQYHYHIPFLLLLLENLTCSHLHESTRSSLIEGFKEVKRLLEHDFAEFSRPSEFVPIEFSSTEL